MAPSPFTTAFPRPDWVMCGMPQPGGDGVRLIASKELDRAELEAQVSRLEVWPGEMFPDPVSQRFLLTAEMRTFTVIDAPDYAVAFRTLFEGWTPGPASRPALTDGQRELST